MKKLKKFSFHQERIIHVSLDIPFTIKAESKKEAIEKAKQYVDSNVEEEEGIKLDEYDSEDLMMDLYEKYQTLDPRANQGKPTSGIFYDENCIACNGDGTWVDS